MFFQKETGENSPRQFWVLCCKAHNVQIQIDEAVVNRTAVSVFWDTFIAVVVLQGIIGAVHAEHTFENFLGLIAPCRISINRSKICDWKGGGKQGKEKHT